MIPKIVFFFLFLALTPFLEGNTSDSIPLEIKNFILQSEGNTSDSIPLKSFIFQSEKINSSPYNIPISEFYGIDFTDVIENYVEKNPQSPKSSNNPFESYLGKLSKEGKLNFNTPQSLSLITKEEKLIKTKLYENLREYLLTGEVLLFEQSLEKNPYLLDFWRFSPLKLKTPYETLSHIIKSLEPDFRIPKKEDDKKIKKKKKRRVFYLKERNSLSSPYSLEAIRLRKKEE